MKPIEPSLSAVSATQGPMIPSAAPMTAASATAASTTTVSAAALTTVSTTTVSTTEARSQLSTFVNRAAYGNEAIVLSRHGRAEAVLVSVAFYQTCMDLLAQVKVS